jgi:hypothetical protein
MTLKLKLGEKFVAAVGCNFVVKMFLVGMVLTTSDGKSINHERS